MKLRMFFLTAIFSFLLLISSSISEQKIGEIYDLTFSPSEPVALQTMTINVGVKNTGNLPANFKLKIFVIKDGQIKHQNSFEFDLQPGKTVSFSSSYVPDDIQEFEILAKLYDKYETELYDSKMLKFNVISDIGPFDLFVEPLTRIVKPGEELPISLTLINKGEKGTDVKIRVEVLCLNSTPLNEFLVFLEPKSSLEKIVSVPTCKEEGLYAVSSNLVLFNKTWVSAMNQFIINKTSFELTLKFPEKIEVQQGESKVFDVAIKNLASSMVTNLKLLIEKIPSEWYSIKPDSITKIEPNETVLFIVNLSIPKDAVAKEYPITIIVAANEVYKKDNSVLKVLSVEAEEIEKISLSQKITNFFDIYKIAFISGLPVAILILVKVKERTSEKRFRESREEILRKLKGAIER